MGIVVSKTIHRGSIVLRHGFIRVCAARVRFEGHQGGCKQSIKWGLISKVEEEYDHSKTPTNRQPR